MKFTINSNGLVAALSRLSGASGGGKNGILILSHVRIVAREGKITLSATDLEVGIIEEIAADVSEQGSLCLPARKLLDIAKELPGRDITVKLDKGGWAVVSSGKAVFKVPGLEAVDFPTLPSPTDANFIQDIEAGPLSEMLDKAIISISTNATRYNLNGVYVEKLSDAGILLASTDGHRLSVVGKNPGDDTADIGGRTIPKKGVQEFRKLLDGGKAVAFGFTSAHAVMTCGTIVVTARLIEGEFPDYSQIIPELGDATVSVNRQELLKTIKRVSILSDDKTKGVKVDIKTGGIEISTTNPGIGEAQESITSDYAGRDISIGFNAKYLLEFLTVMKHEEVGLHITDELTAMIIRDGSDEEFLAIVMPMRV